MRCRLPSWRRSISRTPAAVSSRRARSTVSTDFRSRRASKARPGIRTPGGVAVAGEDGVEPERGVGDVGVEHPLRHDREPLLRRQLGSRRRLLGRGVEGRCWVSHDAPPSAPSAAARDGGVAHRLLAAATAPPALGRTPRTEPRPKPHVTALHGTRRTTPDEHHPGLKTARPLQLVRSRPAGPDGSSWCCTVEVPREGVALARRLLAAKPLDHEEGSHSGRVQPP